jgi:enoyl-CoA hydratase/carnithine racemase
MSDGTVRYTVSDGIATVVFDRPEARNAVTLRCMGPEDGVAYEHRINAAIEMLERLPMPTIAAVHGVATGAGLMIATACDFRFATPAARFGAPIALTVGNCLSMANIARRLAAFGAALTRRMLLLAEMLTADELGTCHFAELVGGDGGRSHQQPVPPSCQDAPLTVRTTHEAIRRLTAPALPDGDDLIRLVYGSADFRAGAAAFMAKEKPSGRGE